MSLRRLLSGILLGFVAVLLISATGLAQEEATPKIDIFVGYQWLHPGATVPSPFQPPNAPVAQKMGDIPQGAGASLTYNFTPHWGLEADYGGNSNKNGAENTASIGPRFAWRSEGVVFFAHTLLGYNRLTVPGVDTSNGIGAILGGGMDLGVWRRLSIRVFEADYVWANHNFADEAGPAFPDLRRPQLSGVRLRTGVVFNFGYPNPAVPAASCSIQPSEVMVGEPVTATASASNFNPKHTVTYTWASTGGKSHGQGQHRNSRHQWRCRRQLYRHRSRHRSQDEEGRRGELHGHLHREGAAEESADHVLLGESDLGSGGHTRYRDLFLYQSGQRAGHGQRLDREWRQRLRRRRHRHSQHHRSRGRPHHGERDLYRFSRPHRLGFEPGNGRGSTATAAGGQQVERVRLPQQGEAMAGG